MLHDGEAIKRQLWTAVIEFAGKGLSINDKKSDKGGNCRRTLNHIVVLYKAFISLHVELVHAEKDEEYPSCHENMREVIRGSSIGQDRKDVPIVDTFLSA